MGDPKGCWSDMHRVTLLDWVRSTQESAFGPFCSNATGLNGAASVKRGKSVGGKSRLSRATSAPAVGTRTQRQFKKEESGGSEERPMARPQSQGAITTSVKRGVEGRQTQSEGAPSKLVVPDIPDRLPDQRWGNEAHDRFILYNTLR